jgi:hypothetical protein
MTITRERQSHHSEWRAVGPVAHAVVLLPLDRNDKAYFINFMKQGCLNFLNSIKYYSCVLIYKSR